MSAVLEGRPAHEVPFLVPGRRWQRWFAGWRVALRLARRDAWRARGRSLLVVVLIALPVATVTTVDLYAHASEAARSMSANALAQLGNSADALVSTTSASAVAQGYTGGPVTTLAEGTPPTPDRILAALPAGSRLVPEGSMVATAIERDGWGLAGSVWVSDVNDPLVAGMWRLRSGRLPHALDEVALTDTAASRLHTSIGDRITLTPPGEGGASVTATLVGLTAASWLGGYGVLLPGAITVRPDPAAAQPAYLAEVSSGLTWGDVRALNAIGAFVISRSVIADPPAFCAENVLCGDSGPVPGAVDSAPAASPDDVAQAVALGVVAVVLVVLQVALLAGPAFAVSLRRRQRELGLLGASGADTAELRRTMLASGVVLGLVGAALGLLVGWAVTRALGATALFDLATADFRMPSPPPELLALAVLGTLAAVAAALVPAVSAGRGDVVDSLRGRRPVPPVSRRTPVTGLAIGMVGLAGMFYGVRALEPVVLGVSIIVAELGLVLVMPALVTAFAVVGRWLPLAPRLAVRDAGRHRMRTTAAACAIAAAAAGSVATAAWAQSSALDRTSANVVWVDGTVLTLVPGPDAGTEMRVDATQVSTVAAAALPGALMTRVVELAPVSAKDPWGGDWRCVMPGPHPADGTGEVDCSGRGTSMGWFNTGIALIEDPAALPAVLGPLAPNDDAIAALQAGKALVLTPGTTDPQGRLSLREQQYDDQGYPKAGQLVTVPAMEIRTGAVPVNVLVGPAALEAGMPLHGLVKERDSTLVVEPAQADSADQPTAVDTLTLAYAKAGLTNVSPTTFRPSEDSLTLVLGIAVGATMLLSLLAGLTVTGLALSDGRVDLATLAAVGAQPAIRRRMAASTAGFIAAVGCSAGALSGIVAARLLVPLFTRAEGSVFVMPWAVFTLTIIGIPLLTAGIAWTITRPRVVMVRRGN